MKITIIGNFSSSGYDEEHIALSFERLGHEVQRLHERGIAEQIIAKIDSPDVVLWFKLNNPCPEKIVEACKEYKTVCWVFDLYIGYQREHRLSHQCFKAKYVFTTDGGHQKEFKEKGINHQVLRQGIFEDERYALPQKPEHDVIFVGSDNPYYKERTGIMNRLALKYKFKWFGKMNTNEVRGKALNELFSKTKIVVGDSVVSPHYWSNRVVETLGRGGFLIHREVEGIKEEYPHLVTYDGTYKDLCDKIDYYLSHDEERNQIVRKNEVKTTQQQCEKLLSSIS